MTTQMYAWMVPQYLMRALGLAALVATSISPSSLAQRINTSDAVPTRQHRSLLDAARLTFSFSHLAEVSSGTNEVLITPLSGGLTNLEVRWKPRLPQVVSGGGFTAIYSFYSQTREFSPPEIQRVSNIATPSFHRWREFYFETPLLRRARLKLGKVDANTEFAVVESGGDLSNASAGVSPTLFTMPSYPDGALSANLFVTSGRGSSVGAGVYRFVRGGAYYIAEAGQRWNGRAPGRIAAGAWNQRDDTIADSVYPNSSGSYFIFEQTVVPRSAGEGLRVFARLSIADEKAPGSVHNMFGAAWTGFGNRHQDSAGVALLHLLPTFDRLTAQPEAAYETYYRLPLADYLEMKIDLQHVRPGGVDPPSCFAVASVRLLFKFSSARAD